LSREQEIRKLLIDISEHNIYKNLRENEYQMLHNIQEYKDYIKISNNNEDYYQKKIHDRTIDTTDENELIEYILNENDKKNIFIFISTYFPKLEINKKLSSYVYLPRFDSPLQPPESMLEKYNCDYNQFVENFDCSLINMEDQYKLI